MSGKKVLVVDDERVWLRILRRLFINCGYTVVTAASCAEGLAAARAEKPDCAVLDLDLGDGTGMEVCRALKSAGAPVPVIIFSGDPAGADCLRSPDGADMVISKESPLLELPKALEFFLSDR